MAQKHKQDGQSQGHNEDVVPISSASTGLPSALAKLSEFCAEDNYPLQKAVDLLTQASKDSEYSLEEIIVEAIEYAQYMDMCAEEVMDLYEEGPDDVTPFTQEQKDKWGIGTPESKELASRLAGMFPTDNDQSLTWRTSHLLETYPPTKEGNPSQVIQEFLAEQAAKKNSSA